MAGPDSLFPYPLTPADRWILSRLQRLIRRATSLLEAYEYAAAKAEIEAFFWTDLADNYLEMCKQRLYDAAQPQREGARFALARLIRDLLKLFAPFLPFVTEAIYQGTFAAAESRTENASGSIHLSAWPIPEPALEDDEAEAAGAALVEIATAVRRYKSEHSLPLGSELERLQVAVEADDGRWTTDDEGLAPWIAAAEVDLKSITRARRIEMVTTLEPGLIKLQTEGPVRAAVEPGETPTRG